MSIPQCQNDKASPWPPNTTRTIFPMFTNISLLSPISYKQLKLLQQCAINGLNVWKAMNEMIVVGWLFGQLNGKCHPANSHIWSGGQICLTIIVKCKIEEYMLKGMWTERDVEINLVKFQSPAYAPMDRVTSNVISHNLAKSLLPYKGWHGLLFRAVTTKLPRHRQSIHWQKLTWYEGWHVTLSSAKTSY